MILGPSGTFSVTWRNIGNLLARKGLRYGSKHPIINYSANYQPIINSDLSVYGWFINPMVEYYIVDSWGSWLPLGGTSVGIITSDRDIYNFDQTQRVNQPSTQGIANFY